MNKYDRLKNDLERNGTGTMTVFGNSMLPILKSGSKLTYETAREYEVGDIVFCKVNGRYIDAHKITKIGGNRDSVTYLIANNKGYENGWTSTIYGKVTGASYRGKDQRV